MRSLKTMDKVGETDALEEVMNKGEKFKEMFFSYMLMNIDMDNYLKIRQNHIL